HRRLLLPDVWVECDFGKSLAPPRPRAEPSFRTRRARIRCPRMASDRAASPAGLLFFLGLLCGGCARTSLTDLPLWRVEIDATGREVRLVAFPFQQVSYDMTTNAVVKEVQDRNQDGVSDRIVTYEGFGGAR